MRHAALVFLALSFGLGCQSPSGSGSAGPPKPAEPAKPAPVTVPAATATPTAAPSTLYERLGGEKRIREVVGDFYSRLGKNALVAPRFARTNPTSIARGFVNMIGEASGGPQRYLGPDMRSMHLGMGITDTEFDSVVGELTAALDGRGVKEPERNELLEALGALRSDIVEPTLTREGRYLAANMKRLESRLARIEAKVDAIPAVTPDQVAKPPVPPKTPPKMEKWTAEEKKLAPEIVRRLTGNPTVPVAPPQPKEARDDLIGRRLALTRFLSSDGEVLDLRDQEGKKKIVLVILRGFVGQVCIHCSAQTLALADNVEEFKKRDAEVVLVYPGEAETVPLFLKATEKLREGFKLPFPVVLDVDLSAVRAFLIEGSLARPTSIVIDEKGIARWAYVGREPGDRPSVADLLAVVDRLKR